jgi:hypothetical protein
VRPLLQRQFLCAKEALATEDRPGQNSRSAPAEKENPVVQW